MNTYKRHQFPADSISYAVWLYTIQSELSRISWPSGNYGQAQQFLGAHAAVSNLFNLGRHLVGAQYYRDLRVSAFSEWSSAVA
jgi:hypothetical protein